jgi:hypothetical protein
MSRRTILAILNPFDRTAGYAIPHALVILLVALGLFLAGAFAGSRFTQNYFRSHYPAPLHVITAPASPIDVKPHAAAAASLNLNRYPGIGDQDGIGACAAWAAAWAMSYEYRTQHPTSWLRFSPRWLYLLYSNAYSGGQDAGSTFPTNVSQARAYGVPRFKQLPYPPDVMADPLPMQDAYGSNLQADANRFKLNWSSQVLTQGQQAGQAAVDAIKAQIAANHPVGIAFPVWPEYDNATNQPLITSPSPAELQSEPNGRGGHENVIIAYSDTRQFPDGSAGGVEVQNQWTAAWGSSGRAWMSYDFVRRFAYELATAHIASAATPPLILTTPTDGKNSHLFPAPRTTGTGRTHAFSWYVHNVHATSGQDLSPILNNAGDRYHVWPVGLAATLGVESDLNPLAERWAGGLDNSCGLAQEIISNVAYYAGIQDARAACNWEELPSNAISLEARMYSTMFAYQNNCVPWPTAYEMYNAGAGYPCSYYFSPASDVYAHQQVFLGWYNYALTHWQGPPPPPPRPAVFPIKLWNAFRASHHLTLISAYTPVRVTRVGRARRTRLRWEARAWWSYGPARAGGIVSHPQWIPHGSFMTVRFKLKRYYFWPHHPGWQKWQQVRRIQ